MSPLRDLREVAQRYSASSGAKSLLSSVYQTLNPYKSSSQKNDVSRLNAQQGEFRAHGGLTRRFGPGRGCFQCFIQDNDPRVRYTGPWNLNQQKFLTTHSSTTPGSIVSLTFNGAGITVFGTVAASNATARPPTVAYRVNAIQPFTTTQPVADRDVFNQPLFSYAFGTERDENNITIQVLQAETPFILERFFIFPGNSTVDGEENNPDSDFLPPPDNSTTSNMADPSLTLPGATGLNDVNTVRLLAGFLGVITLLALAMAIFLVLQCVRRRRSRLRCRPETFYTHFTSTDTIFPPSLNYSGSDGTRSTHGRRINSDPPVRESMLDYPPVPPKSAHISLRQP